eukprot:TRINITY_DN21238_c0_g1_i6.p1 TRINITY_DN21238_c0_g1~~TRINITY_DN21238_c0_g1_i6.p1  ORF type:complete len:138 (+),score=0.94 TRINITY_DN21238_c0_g1_i6:117-530(+)
MMTMRPVRLTNRLQDLQAYSIHAAGSERAADVRQALAAQQGSEKNEGMDETQALTGAACPCRTPAGRHSRGATAAAVRKRRCSGHSQDDSCVPRRPLPAAGLRPGAGACSASASPPEGAGALLALRWGAALVFHRAD